MVRGFLILALSGAAAAAPSSAPPPQIVSASGQWAVLRKGATCEAASLGLRPALKDRRRARASLAFEARRGGRQGEFAARLGRVSRPGATVMLHIGAQPFLLVSRGDLAWSRGPAQDAAIIAAIRAGGGMRIEAGGAGGGRIVERFDLAGAATAIDGAAACSAALANR